MEKEVRRLNTNYFKNIIMGSVFRKAQNKNLLDISSRFFMEEEDGSFSWAVYAGIGALFGGGLRFSYENDGMVSVNGTPDYDVSFPLGKYNFKKKGVYVLSGAPEGAGADTYFLYFGTAADYGASCVVSDITGEKTLGITVKKGVTVENLIFKPQLETGSVATDFVPYAALPRNYYLGISSTVPTVEGKNVTEPSTVNSGYGRVLLSSSLSTPSNGVIVNTDSISFPESKTDWFSASSPAIYYVIYDSYTGGNLLMYNQLTAPRIIEENTIVTIKANSIYLRLLD